MPKFIVVTSHGLAKYLKKELELIFNVPALILNESKVIIETNWQNALKILRYGRGMARIVFLLKEFEFDGKDTLQKNIEEINFEEFLDLEKTFAVRCSRHGEHDFKSPDIEQWGGEAIIRRIIRATRKRIKVNLETPDYVVRIYVINNHAWIGLDLIGNLSLNNRWYRVKKHPAGLRSTIAFQLVLASNWNPENEKKKILDPTTGSGTIPIEASLWAINYPVNDYIKNNFSVKHWDFIPLTAKQILIEKQEIQNKGKVAIGIEKVHKFYSYALINTERANVKENIVLIHGDAFELETLISLEEIDAMVFNPPFGIRMGKKEYLIKLYNHLLKTASQYSIRKIAFLTTKIGLAEKIAQKNDLQIIDKTMFLYGKINAYLIEARA